MEANKHGSGAMRQQDMDLTLEGGGAAGGLDGQLHSSAEAELSLKNGAWPISKGQSPEREHTTLIMRGCGLPV